MKQLKHIRVLLLTLLVTLFAGQAFAEDVTVTKTVLSLATENKWTVSSGTTIGTLATEFKLDDVVTISTSGEANCGSVWANATSTSDDWRLYQNKSGDVTISVATGYELVSATFTFSNSNSGALLDGTTALKSGTAVSLSGSSKTFTVGNSGAKTNGQIKITQFSVVYKSNKTLSSLAISGTPTKTTYEAGDAFDPAGLVVTGTYSDESTAKITDGITWTLDPETLSAGATSCDVMATVGSISSDVTTISGLTVNAASKTLSKIVVSGTPAEFWKGDTFNHDGMTVTATYDDESTADVTADATFSTPDMTTAGEQTVTATYKGKTDSYKINVQTIANTQETAYTVAQAIAKYTAGHDLTSQVYVKGTVSAITTPWSESYNNATYAISEDGTTTSTQFLLYRCVTNNVSVGDDVIAYGTLSTYSGAVQMAADNTIVAQTKAATASIANIAVKKGETITPVITTSITGEYLVEYTSDNENVVIADGDELATGDELGTANITATIVADGYKTVTTTFTVTVTSNATLSSITVGGDLKNSTYTLGEEFSFEGLTATGNYSDETTADLTSTVTWSVEPATLTAATTSVTVKATSGEISGTKEYAITVNKKEASIAIADMEIGKNATDVAISATTTPDDATLTYEITDGSDYITITDGKISAVAPGTATVKATYAGNDEFATAETTFTVNVIDASVATYTFSSFTSADDVTLTDLDGFTITLSKGTGSSKPAWSNSQARIYAKGTLTVKATNADIKSIVYEYTVNANSKNISPTIDGVAGTTTAGTWNADTKTWTGSDSEVKFSTSGSAGNVGFTKLTITYVQGTKTETSLEWSASEATVTMDANDNVFPTLTTTPENLEGVTYESSATTVATIAEDGTVTLVAPGTTTITAKYAGDDTHTEATPASYTLTVKEAPFVPVVVAEGYEAVDFSTISPYKDLETNKSCAMETYKGKSFKVEFTVAEKATAPKYYQNGNSVRVYANNTITITGAEEIKGVIVNYTEGSNNATTTLDGKTATITFSDKARFTTITVWYKTVEADMQVVADLGCATFCAPFEVAIPEGVKAYTADKVVDNSWISMTEVEGTISAATPVVLYAKDGYTETKVEGFPVNPTATTCTNGVLTGNIGTEKSEITTTDGSIYLLQRNENTETQEYETGWYKVATSGLYIGVNRCYMTYNGTNAREFYPMSFEGEATGINSIAQEARTKADGKYLVNGKIVVVKAGKAYNVNGVQFK